MKIVIAGLYLAAALGVSGMAGADEIATSELDYDSAKEIIWEKELSIYAGRARGDMQPYLDGTATGYSAWPPHLAEPNTVEDVRTAVSGNKEVLDMEFVSFTMSGTTAIIYYTAHMTRSSAGETVDYRYDNTHTWTYEDGVWRVLGGMARSTPDRN